MPLVKWHAAEQAWSALGRILVDRDVDRGRPMGGQNLDASEDVSDGRRRAPSGIEGLRQRLLDDALPVHGRVNPYNPCLPYLDSRTCERHPSIENKYAPFDDSPNYLILN